MSLLRSATFKLTVYQLEQLDEMSERTGLPKTELMRRAFDAYYYAEQVREEQRLMTPQQRREVRRLAQRHSMSIRDTFQEIFQPGLVRLQEKPIKVG